MARVSPARRSISVSSSASFGADGETTCQGQDMTARRRVWRCPAKMGSASSMSRNAAAWRRGSPVSASAMSERTRAGVGE